MGPRPLVELLGGSVEVPLWQVCHPWCQMLVSTTSWRIVWVLRHDRDHLGQMWIENQAPTLDDQVHCSDCHGHHDTVHWGSRLVGKTGLADSRVSSPGFGDKATGSASSHA